MIGRRKKNSEATCPSPHSLHSLGKPGVMEGTNDLESRTFRHSKHHWLV